MVRNFIVTAGVMIYLYRRWTDDYPRWRNTLGIATGLALIGFAFFPLLPPRLLDSYSQVHHLGIHYGFVDTLNPQDSPLGQRPVGTKNRRSSRR